MNLQSFIHDKKVSRRDPNLKVGNALKELYTSANALGLHGAGYAFWRSTTELAESTHLPQLGMQHSFSQGLWCDWLEQYIESVCAPDPVHQSCRETLMPVFWGADSETTNASDEQFDGTQIEAFRMCYENTGIRSGIGVPIRGINGAKGYIAFLSSDRVFDLMDKREFLITHLLPKAFDFYSALTEYVDPARNLPKLSPRELQCLRAMAGGMTMDQTACHLGISTTTVRYHLQNATEKYGVGSRIQALSMAISDGILEQPYYVYH